MSDKCDKSVSLRRDISCGHIVLTLISVTGNVAVFISPAIIAGHLGSVAGSLLVSTSHSLILDIPNFLLST